MIKFTALKIVANKIRSSQLYQLFNAPESVSFSFPYFSKNFDHIFLSLSIFLDYYGVYIFIKKYRT